MKLHAFFYSAPSDIVKEATILTAPDECGVSFECSPLNFANPRSRAGSKRLPMHAIRMGHAGPDRAFSQENGGLIQIFQGHGSLLPAVQVRQLLSIRHINLSATGFS